MIALLQPKRSGLPARMAEFVSIRGLQRDKGAGAAATDEDDAAEQNDWWTRFEETLEIAEIKIEPEMDRRRDGRRDRAHLPPHLRRRRARRGGRSSRSSSRTSSREWVLRTLARRRNRFAEQLPDALQVIASALRSGHSFAGALAVVVESASEPMKSEMQRVVADEQLGIPIQDSLGVVAERMASRDVEQLALVAQLQREAGGDAAEVDRPRGRDRARALRPEAADPDADDAGPHVALDRHGAADRRGDRRLAREPALLPPAASTLGGKDRPRLRRRLGHRRIARDQEDRRDRGLRC